jgi:NAD(P)H-nitrite reductase large subunit
MAEIVSLDLKERTAVAADGQTYRGDYLVLAAGSQPDFLTRQKNSWVDLGSGSLPSE